MKKSVVSMISAGILVVGSTAAFASPLADYSAGKTAVDITWRKSAVDANSQFSNDSLDKKGNVEFGVTTGLGGKYALQYTYANNKSADTMLPDGAGSSYRENGSLKVQDFNVLYKLDKNVSLYTGIVSLKGNVDAEGGAPASASTSKMQLGVIGQMKIGSKTTAYAQLGLASHFTNWKIGVSQEVVPNVDLDINYRMTDAKRMGFDNGMGNVDMKAKGLGIGLTFKF